ncbi:MAG: 1,4-alpha-glucan branching protein domain-containing protein, partial [Promethearchaeota archaeon]
KLLKELYDRFKDQYEPLSLDTPKSPYFPYICGSRSTKRPVFFFTRDDKTGIVVWSGEHGYPGDGNYLEFHKKHFPGGHRYWKVTSAKADLGSKMEYYPEDTKLRIEENASHFKNLVKLILSDVLNETGKPGIVVSMYDSELFGHWWWEGPEWMGLVLKWMEDDPELDLTTAGQYLVNNTPNVVVNLTEGSWGQGGYHWVWLNDWTKWTWELIYECEHKYTSLLDSGDSYKNDGVLYRLLVQLGRELLLLQSSDWQFLITTWAARDYAENRVAEHYEKFKRLYEIVEHYKTNGELTQDQWQYLSFLEKEDGIFPDLEPDDFKL